MICPLIGVGLTNNNYEVGLLPQLIRIFSVLSLLMDVLKNLFFTRGIGRKKKVFGHHLKHIHPI